MSDLIKCKVCLEIKPCDDFNPNKKEGGYHSNCKLCFRAEEAEYWRDKKFKKCFTCKVMLPVRKYEFQAEIPYRSCRKCFETYVAEMAVERERLAANEKDTKNVSKTSSNVPQVSDNAPKEPQLPRKGLSYKKKPYSFPTPKKAK